MARRMLSQVGVAAFLGACLAQPMANAQVAAHSALPVELYIDENYEELVGGEIVFSVTFRDPLTGQLRPQLRAHEGETVSIRLVNRTRQTHAFALMGVDGTMSKPVKAGATGALRFVAPGPGSYIYYDPSDARPGRTPGLFGDFVVTPNAMRKPG